MEGLDWITTSRFPGSPLQLEASDKCFPVGDRNLSLLSLAIEFQIHKVSPIIWEQLIFTHRDIAGFILTYTYAQILVPPAQILPAAADRRTITRQTCQTREFRGCRCKGFFCAYNVCLYAQVKYVYVRGPGKSPVSCCRKQNRAVCCWNRRSSKPGELGFWVDRADVVWGEGIMQERGGQCRPGRGFIHN